MKLKSWAKVIGPYPYWWLNQEEKSHRKAATIGSCIGVIGFLVSLAVSAKVIDVMEE